MGTTEEPASLQVEIERAKAAFCQYEREGLRLSLARARKAAKDARGRRGWENARIWFVMDALEIRKKLRGLM